MDIYALEKEISDIMEQQNFQETLTSYIIYVKSTHSRGIRQRLDLPDISVESWAKVERSMRAQHVIYPGYKLNIIVECIGQAPDLKRLSAAMDTPLSPTRRKTRTSQQEELGAYRRDQNEAAGDQSKELLDKWRCISSKCDNEHSMCFVAFDRKHYSINITQKTA